jgi:hypothetical protein
MSFADSWEMRKTCRPAEKEPESLLSIFFINPWTGELGEGGQLFSVGDERKLAAG